MKTELVPGRSCGTCNVCCVGLTIDEPTLRKPQGFRCRNAQPDNSCAIYESRPPSCRSFYCGWRLLKWIPEPLRPDKCGILVRMYQPTSNKGPQRPGLVVMPQPTSTINSDGFCDIVIAGIKAGLQIYLDIPGEPGYASAIMPINKPIAPAATARNKPAILNFLRDVLTQAGRIPRSVITLAPEVRPASTESTPPGVGGESPQSASTREPN